jgi:hypothetical protein
LIKENLNVKILLGLQKVAPFEGGMKRKKGDFGLECQALMSDEHNIPSQFGNLFCDIMIRIRFVQVIL